MGEAGAVEAGGVYLDGCRTGRGGAVAPSPATAIFVARFLRRCVKTKHAQVLWCAVAVVVHRFFHRH